MAKLGKQKPGEQKYQSLTESDRVACAVVRHEKLCLRVDLHNQRLHGFAELRVVAPAKGVVGFHAQGLNVERVLYDGVPTEFEVIHRLKDDHYGDGNTLIVNQDHLSASDAADTAHARYLGALEKEMVPGLLVFVPELSVASHGNHDVPQTGSDAGTMKGVEGEKNGPESILEGPKEEVADHTEEKVKLVHVDYWLEKPESGAYFVGNMFHTSNQSCRARCWFPCVDLDFQRCSYEMEITVDSEFVAVSCGRPLYQVISKEGSHLKTYVYKLDIPVAARLVSLIVAPLEVLPDRQNISITHFCIPGSLVQLQCTSAFFHSAYSFYEDYLGASFPFGSYNLVFVDSESTISSALVGAAITILSSHLLVDEKVIDQTMNTRIKLAYSLAQQWFGVYISPETHNDAWLLEGLCIYLTDLFIKRHFGNNEMYYRRFKANEAVCKVDVNGAPPLCPCMNLFGTEKIGGLGRIRSMKAAAVVQMLEKQMGPEAFRKILQRIILRAQDPVRNLRTLSTKEFRHFANKLGNLERPFLKDFFHRWVESPGCPILRMGFVYSKRRNLIELAVHRGCTAVVDSDVESKGEAASDRPRLTDAGWPGMMSIRVHELDGMFDHPSLPMAGDPHQLLEIHCHSKMAGRRIPRPKKGNKLEGAEEADQLPAAADGRQNVESPLLWVRADPQMEYLAEIQLQQPEQMWINQLEKDRDVVAQLQAITALSSLPQMSFTAVNALNHCLMDSKIFYRVRIEAAFALANTATEANGWVGLSHLIKLYKQRRYDPEIGLPRPNDFHDLAEYFVLQVIPGAIATIRGSDGKSPPEAVEFILQLLKHNDNSGNQFSDVYWLSSIIRSVGQLEFGQQGLQALQRILKRVDNFLQYDRIMPSYNNLITVSCIHTITELALKFSDLLPVGHVQQILNPFLDSKKVRWRVRAEVLKALVELEIHLKGLDSGIQLAIQLIDADQSPRVQNKVIAHTFRMCTLKENVAHTIQSTTLSQLLHLFQTRRAFNNTILRHQTFSMLQVLGGRPATLFRIKRLEPKPPAKTEPAASIENTAPLAEAKVKAPSFKVRLQPPQEAPIEPVRIRLVSTGSQPLKESIPTMSGTSSGKQESDRKVGLLKLRLKPTSSAQETAFETLRDKGLGSGPAQSSSMSVELGAKEANLIESPHSIMHVGVGSASVKEDSDDICKIGSQKEPSSSNDVSAGKNGSMKRPCNTSAQLRDSKSKHQMSSLDAVVQRIVSEAGGSPPEQELQAHVDESHGEQQSGHEDATLHSKLKLEEEGSSQVEPGDTNEVSHKSKKKRADGEHKDREKKRHREKDDSRQDDERGKRRDKHSDPEYLERKRLKKEKRREEQRRLLNADRDGASSTAKADLPLPLQQKPVTGTSETVVRLKIKKFQADN